MTGGTVGQAADKGGVQGKSMGVVLNGTLEITIPTFVIA